MNPSSNTFVVAIVRGLYGAIVSGLLTGLGILQQSDETRTAVIAGLIAALTYLTARGGLEGAYDQSRQASGNQKASDVSSNQVSMQ